MASITIEFTEENKAEFTIDSVTAAQACTALLSLEAYVANNSGLPIEEVRGILDDMKQDLLVRE
jgi:hypothetical protein